MDNERSDLSAGATGLAFRERADALLRREPRSLLQELRTSLRRARQESRSDDTGWRLLDLAVLLRAQRQFTTVFRLLDEAKNVFIASANEHGLAVAFNETALANLELDHSALALDYAAKAMKLFQTQSRTLELAWAYDNLSAIHRALFHRPESLAFAKKARGIFIEFGSDLGLAWNACHLAALHLDMRFFDESAAQYSEALSRFNRLNHPVGSGMALFGLAAVQKAQSHLDAAESFLLKAEEIFRLHGLADYEARCVLEMAAVKRFRGRDSETVLLNKRAMQMLGPLRLPSGVGVGFWQLGQLFRERGQLMKAWQALRQAGTLLDDSGQRLAAAAVENELSQTYLEMGDLPHARESLVRARVVAEQLDGAELRADVEKNIARINMDDGHLTKADETMGHARNLAEKAGTRPVLAETLILRARYWLALGESRSAFEALEAALSVVEAYDLNVYRPEIELISGELRMFEGDRQGAERVWIGAERVAKQMRQRRVRAESLMGILQLRLPDMSEAQIDVGLEHIEKDVRAVGSKRLRAKLIALKGFAAERATGQPDAKLLIQSVELLGECGLFTLQKRLVDIALPRLRLIGDREAATLANVRAEMLEQAPSDVRLVMPPLGTSSALPVPVSL